MITIQNQLTDFEFGTIKSTKSLFPNVVNKGNVLIEFINMTNNFAIILGCRFHSGQCLWRQLQGIGLQKKYQEDKTFNWDVRKLIALAVVPVSDVIKAFDLTADDFDDDDEFLDYFEKHVTESPRREVSSSVGKLINLKLLLSRNGRKKSKFPIELWNMHDRVSTNLPRSSNSFWGWRKAFAKRVSIDHPTIAKLTDKIRREQFKFQVDIAETWQGHEPKSKKRTYRLLDERIQRLVDDYGNIDLGEYPT